MKAFFLTAVVLQGILMLIDEFYFHWKRKLPKWERWGHPVDTFFFLIPMCILGFRAPTETWQITYILISVVSSIIITKDEWVHRERSPASEQWLHSVLFMLHPVVLITGFFVWSEGWAPFRLIAAAIFVFWIYQILFWNFYANRVFKI